MPKATWIQPSFNAGEWSPMMYGRVDLRKYHSALTLCKRFVPRLQGALTRCPGTLYKAQAKVSTSVRLVRFEFSTVQAYVLEFGNNYIRFYTEDGQLLSGGAPYEVATTYTEAELWDLSFTQSADVLYVAHPSHAPAKLSRQGATNWTLADVAAQDGPYLNRNLANNYVSGDSSTPGSSCTLTFGGTDNINNGAGFSSADVGRLVRVENSTSGAPTQFVWVEITSVTDSKTVVGTVKNLSAV